MFTKMEFFIFDLFNPQKYFKYMGSKHKSTSQFAKCQHPVFSTEYAHSVTKSHGYWTLWHKTFPYDVMHWWHGFSLKIISFNYFSFSTFCINDQSCDTRSMKLRKGVNTSLLQRSNWMSLIDIWLRPKYKVLNFDAALVFSIVSLVA